jgi:hypothetical protein
LDSHHVGDLVLGQLPYVAQQQCRALTGRQVRDKEPEFAGRAGHVVAAQPSEQAAFQGAPTRATPSDIEADLVGPSRRRSHPRDAIPPLEGTGESLVGGLLPE